MKLNRWVAIPLAGVAAVAIGVAAVEAAPSPSPSAGGTSKNYVQVFVDKLAAILHLSPTQTRDALKQAELQTVDQMLADGRITQAQAKALKDRINAGQGLGPLVAPGFKRGFPGPGAGVMRDLMNAELNAVASALHLSTTDLMSALRSGKSLSDLETQQHVSDSDLKAAMKNAAKGVLDKAVKAGTITQAQEDSILSKIGTGRAGFGFGFGFGRKGFHGGTPTPGQSPSQSPAATPAAFFSTI